MIDYIFLPVQIAMVTDWVYAHTMALDLENSPYATSLQHSQAQDGLGYSRHYAQRIRDMGKSSKDTWIKRLWSHMFQGNKKTDKTSPSSNQMKESSLKHPTMHLPPISTNQKSTSQQPILKKEPKEVTFAEARIEVISRSLERDGSRSAPLRRGEKDGQGAPGGVRMLPVQLADSPYIPAREKLNYRVSSLEKKAHSSGERPKRAKESQFMRKPGSHPYLSQNKDDWKPKLTRGLSMINLEKRAKSSAEKAMKVRWNLMGVTINNHALVNSCVNGNAPPPTSV